MNDDDDYWLDDGDFDLMACGKDTDGQCDQAGTEFCDWDCPLRDLI